MSSIVPGDAPASPGTSFQEMKNWLAVWRTPGMGSRRFFALLQAFQDPAAILSASESSLKAAGMPQPVSHALKHPDWRAIDQDLEWLAGDGRHIMLWQDADYPRLLREISDPPPVLYIHGERELLNDIQLAVVGSRNPSPVGLQTAKDFAAELAKMGLGITSGMALGIDAAAHRGALTAGGKTIAVAATGLDRVYPARHRGLAEQIVEHGALVSEFPVGTRPLAGYFPRRNRIISGLSVGVLVVEAARQSGSLVTARLAMEQGREVFAIPGSIHNPLAKGCHALIQQGAKLVESAQDILIELQALVGTFDAQETVENQAASEAETKLPESYQKMLQCIGFEPTSVDALVAQSGCSAQEISSMLLVLELQGYVSSSPGGCYYRISPSL